MKMSVCKLLSFVLFTAEDEEVFTVHFLSIFKITKELTDLISHFLYYMILIFCRF